jgi:maltose/glucose PTS system EIICB component
MPFIGGPIAQFIFVWMREIGSVAFNYLPVMFAIAIPLGLARENKGVAAFSSFVGFMVLNLAINLHLKTAGVLKSALDLETAGIQASDYLLDLKTKNIQMIMGIESINTGVLGSILVGVVVYFLHERFHKMPLLFLVERVLYLSLLP